MSLPQTMASPAKHTQADLLSRALLRPCASNTLPVALGAAAVIWGAGVTSGPLIATIIDGLAADDPLPDLNTAPTKVIEKTVPVSFPHPLAPSLF